MGNKLSWTELRRLLAQRAGSNEKEATLFLTAFNTELIKALKRDKQVKINGLGIFKLQAVAPRKSVNVSTGEQITIEGYNKIVFAPEAGVKELVAQGPQENEEITPLKKLGEQAEEIVDILADLGQSPSGEITPEAPVAEEPVVETPAPEEPVVETPAPEPIPAPEPVVEIPQPTVHEAPKKTQPQPKKYHFLRDTLITVLILLLILAGGYYFLRTQIASILQNLLQPQPTEQVAQPAPEEPVAETPAPAEEVQSKDTVPLEPIFYEDLITIEKIRSGSRLTWMAKRYYGDKMYWPYLYDANRDRITNPSDIAIGTPIRVPRLTAEQMDTTIERSRLRLEQLTREAQEACKN